MTEAEKTVTELVTDREANVAVAREWLADQKDPSRVHEWLAAQCPDHFADAAAAKAAIEG